MRIVWKLRQGVTEPGERGSDALPVARQIARQREALLGMPLPANQMQPQIALEDAARLTNLAAVHAYEVGCLGIEGAGVNLTRHERAIEQRRKLVEISFHVHDLLFLPAKE